MNPGCRGVGVTGEADDCPSEGEANPREVECPEEAVLGAGEESVWLGGEDISLLTTA